MIIKPMKEMIVRKVFSVVDGVEELQSILFFATEESPYHAVTTNEEESQSYLELMNLELHSTPKEEVIVGETVKEKIVTYCTSPVVEEIHKGVEEPYLGITIMEEMQGESKGKVAGIQVYESSRSNVIEEFDTKEELDEWLKENQIQVTGEGHVWFDLDTMYRFRTYLFSLKK
ncbi:hypothetical protein ACQUY5_32195 [Bacillus cereus]|uniref:hypothetical protein n=1 Tax=Bacillus cereus TaxID=1396 RepID=UPI003D17EC20